MPISIPPTSARRDAVLAAGAFAALTLPDPDRLGPAGRHLLRLGSAAVAGWAGWRATQDEDVPFVPPAAFGAAAGAAAGLALAPLEEATDRWLHASLRGAGLRHPRLVMAVAAAGLGALAVGTGRTSSDGGCVPVEDLYTERELDPSLRRILQSVLAAGPSGPAAALTAQLTGARAQTMGDDFESTVTLVVEETLARVVPHTQCWPVRARWEIDGHPVELVLQVHGGRLDHVSLLPVEEEYAEDVDPFEVTPVDDPGNNWPDLAAVTLVEETPEGLRPARARERGVSPAGG